MKGAKSRSDSPDLGVEIAGLSLKNPVLPASGTFGFGQEYSRFLDLNDLGALVVKSLTLKPTPGNPPPRIVETPAGLLNAIGLENPGLEVFLQEKLPFLRQFSPPLIVSLAGKTMTEYAELAEQLSGTEGVAALEINISCPNVKEGGLAFGSDPASAAALTAAVRRVSRLPLIVKLSPNVTDITEIALAVEAEGADALAAINTLVGMAIDLRFRRPFLANGSGGLSGPAIKPVALYQVWRVAGAVSIPVIGMGGITSAADAMEFILAGATAVAVGTATLIRPGAMLDIIQGLENYLRSQGVISLRELVGAARR